MPQGSPTSCAAAGPLGASHQPSEVPHRQPPPPPNRPHSRRPFPVSVRDLAAAKRALRSLLSVVVPSVRRLAAVIAGVAGPSRRPALWPSGASARCGPLRNPAQAPGQAGSWAGFGLSTILDFLLFHFRILFNSRNVFKLQKSATNCRSTDHIVIFSLFLCIKI
jgi:hypothetical protein